ncbi:hypothetical protein HXX76_009636 [Chlamydomonas incerta]|uniref:DUF2177 family protein n=1 Tax=Chlamydomonas incerta TaxID=51695 RepID=A0A835T3V4_CHLIN|nr:hypothetical protein HXX76_009636 [Chlamydomonas incerta]|eukprot:KAG2431106.1 hypothetical protein HXX76_009636 [Chlamydomonas incerta]
MRRVLAAAAEEEHGRAAGVTAATLLAVRAAVEGELENTFMYQPIAETVEEGAQAVAKMAIPIWKQSVVFLASLVAFVALDMTWIILVAGNIYKNVLGDFLRQPDPVAGILAWICIVGAVYYFALPSSRGSPALALRQGALLGLGIYGCYEFTNLSILERWTWGLAAADTVWGCVACGVVCWIQLMLTRRLA